MNRNKLSFCADIDAEEYHQAARDGRYLSSHLLGDFRKAPKLYRMKMSGEIEPAESAALTMGRAVHSLILEGRSVFEKEFMVSDGPVNPKTGEPFGRLTKAYREWAAAQDKCVVTGQEFSLMAKMQQSVWTHPVAMQLLDEGIAEQTVRTHYCGEPCQIRMDWFRSEYEGRPVICDLKTCENIDWFESDARRYGYPHQAAFYREVLLRGMGNGERGKVEMPAALKHGVEGDSETRREFLGMRDCGIDCYLIAVEKREPYRCGVWKFTDAILQASARENERAIAELQECRSLNRWPTRLEDLRILDL